MYFPYLRGRQNELIAIRELVEEGLLSTKIIPIIEPIKVSSTLVKTLTVFKDSDRKVVYIINPAVGSYLSDLSGAKNGKIKNDIDKFFLSKEKKDVESKNLILGVILSVNLNSIKNYREEYSDDFYWLAISTNIDALTNYPEVFGEEGANYNLIPDDATFRRHMRKNKNKVMLSDRFKKLERNTDYIGVENIFSEDHIIYEEDNYFGFSDYSIVGDNYSDTGFAPYAVAIHIVYFEEIANEQILKIKHFVSQSNDDITNPAGKFAEALKELIDWKTANENHIKLNTLAMRKFQELYEKESYPGLGSVKKLAIMHHLELMSRYLDGEIK